MREKGATGKRFEWAKQSANDELPPLDLAVCPACKHTKIVGQRCESAFCRGRSGESLVHTIRRRILHSSLFRAAWGYCQTACPAPAREHCSFREIVPRWTRNLV